MKSKLPFILLLGFWLLSSSAEAIGNAGTDFWLSFPYALNVFSGARQTIVLLLSGGTATTATVLDPGIGVPATYPITPGATTAVTITSTDQLKTIGNDTITHAGIHVTAPDDITVYGVNYITENTDGFLALPTASLGTSYIVMGYPNTLAGQFTEFSIVGTQNGTNVTITPSISTYSRVGGVPYTLTLNQGDTYELAAKNQGSDLTGSLIQSSAPLAVFTNDSCAFVPNGSYENCNQLLEELWPTNSWGTQFVTIPLATRSGGDTFQFLASTYGTTVNVNGTAVASLNSGQYATKTITGPAFITANYPIDVAQYSNSTTYDGSNNADPFMITVPPVAQYTTSYIISVLGPNFGFSPNYENIFVPTSAVGTVLLDGVAIPAGAFTLIGASGYSGAAVSVTAATHVLFGPTAFGVLAYGFNRLDGYGYPGGLLVSVINTPVPTPTFTPTFTPTQTFTVTQTSSPTHSPTPTPTFTLTQTSSPTYSPSPTYSFTLTLTPTATSTFTPTFTLTPTDTSTRTPTVTNTPTRTYTPTMTYTRTNTPTATNTFTCQGSLYVSRNLYRPLIDQPPLFIRTTLCVSGPYSVKIYDSAGELVRVLRDNHNQMAGPDQVEWDGKNKIGTLIASGVYIIRLTEPFSAHSARVVVIH